MYLFSIFFKVLGLLMKGRYFNSWIRSWQIGSFPQRCDDVLLLNIQAIIILVLHRAALWSIIYFTLINREEILFFLLKANKQVPKYNIVIEHDMISCS